MTQVEGDPDAVALLLLAAVDQASRAKKREPTMTANRHSQACPHCGIAATLPEWSEAVAEKETVCIWRCMGCGNEFETADKVVVQGPTIIELVEEFLPNLVVA